MTSLIQLETERTFLRNLTPADATDFFNLNQDPEVLKYTGDLPFESIETAKLFLEQYDQYKKYGVGRLAVIHKQSNQFIGWCGLRFAPSHHNYDIGFRFFREHWNQGYATETANACLDFAFTKRKLERVIGRTVLDNIASIVVLQKIGFQFKEHVLFDKRPGCIYELTKQEYEKSRW
jgi:ribosomal-protein-alanine N-acetyltransferase